MNLTKPESPFFKSHFFIMSIFPISLIIMSLVFDSPSEIIRGLYRIIVSPSVLIADYIEIGGIGAAFMNAGILMLSSVLLSYFLNFDLDGPLIASIFTFGGFAFMGKNILNVLPIFLGGYIYSKYKKIEFKSMLIVVMFATTLAPVTTIIAFGLDINLLISIPLSILIGVVIGLVIHPSASQMLKAHDGYNLYNMGFTGGVVGTLIASTMRSFGFTWETQSVLSAGYSTFLRDYMILMFIVFIVLGYFFNDGSFRKYKKVFDIPGRLANNFTELIGYGNTYINMGIMGLIAIFYVVIINGTFNGPVLAGIMTVAGFSAYGKHPKNTIPIILGVYIAGILTIYEVTSTSMIIAALFGTTLAPIPGGFGWIPGIIAGFFHVIVVTNIGVLHGGLNLYNNGFSGGIVAAMIVPALNRISKRDKA